ncbi:MAG: hypothetical protein IKC04_08540, partial [Oscillospiraceae bacterium]|nr:hypothetical protein [Oscillospiraceae bacterium]
MSASVFSYYFGPEFIENCELPRHYRFGKYSLSVDAQTPYQSFKNQSCECALFGYAVNLLTAEYDSIPEKILKNCTNIDEVVKYESDLGGKYLIFYKNGENYYVLGDATSSVPVFYSLTGTVICTNRCRSIVEKLGLRPDAQYMKIRKCGDISQAMPFDITVYKEIKQLLPNHYFDVNKAKAVRFVNAASKQKKLSVAEAAEKVLPRIDVLTRYYQSIFPISCPITSGRDSRVVLAFLLANGFFGDCYTIKHPEHNELEQDLVIPREMCSAVNIPHTTITDVALGQQLTERMDSILGKDNYSTRTLRIAQTIKEYCGDRAIINGDIIGQVGKCSLHRDIPTAFATPAYFRCKLHNYSKEALNLLRSWMAEIKQSGEQVNAFDLFSVESRMGRWAAQENL